ncbi:hypothetical protein [Aeromicrobium sp. REDSEA-S38_B2]|uniref:hypothetical protein n=1 Tax=Aeromicrobium sp. REDSEA-S38_B2 TaxID=1811528 RepID=UPI000B2364E2|nr:hypothetical protein [Aeromicrobium sp. REDSEA-S38_B2]
MTSAPRRPLPVARATSTVVLALVASLVLGACSLVDREPAPAATPTATASPTPAFNSQFTRDGTFQSHVKVGTLDFVYTIWPTKSTPRTNEWYPLGDKYFSFTLQAYDLSRRLRDPFRTKRRVYLGKIQVSSATTTSSGEVENPYTLDADARRITFDPEPVASRYGMLITSPKGAFELRNQKIGPLAADTKGVTLTFKATVWIQRRAGSREYVPELVTQEVPIAIFASKTPTEAQKIPINAN